MQTASIVVSNKYGPNPTTDQHVIMLNNLLPGMINSLMQANGSTIVCDGNETSGECLHFKSLILNGFSLDLLENELGISLDLHAQNYNNYLTWMLSQPLSQTLNACK